MTDIYYKVKFLVPNPAIRVVIASETKQSKYGMGRVENWSMKALIISGK
jgi:hypothetical protein